MMRAPMNSAVITAAALLLPASAVAGPAIASDWATLDMSQDQCLGRGEAAIRRMNFGAIEQTRYSRFGQDGDYTISVRCVPEKGVVLFLAAGPSQRRALEYQIELHRSYLK
jgi:hypothetical protein